MAPADFIEAPTLAVPIALERAGLTISDIALWEFNEAFSVAIRTVEKVLGLNPAKVNINGCAACVDPESLTGRVRRGAVALGHAIGNSGSRIVVTLVHALHQGQFGVAGICNGVRPCLPDS